MATTASQSRSQSHNAQTGMTMWQPWRYRDLCFYELFVKLAARTCALIDERFAAQSKGKRWTPSLFVGKPVFSKISN